MNRSYGAFFGRLSGLSILLGSACLIIAMLLAAAGAPVSAADSLVEASLAQEESPSQIPACTSFWITATNTPIPPDTDTPTPTETPTLTDTLVPPTETFTPTATPPPSEPPTDTATPTSTSTEVPPSMTPTPTITEVPPSMTPTSTNTQIPPTDTPTATRTSKPPRKSPTPTQTLTSTVPGVPELTTTSTSTPIPLQTPVGTLPPPTPPAIFVQPPIIVPVTGGELTSAQAASARFIPIFLNLGIGMIGIGLVASGISRRLRQQDDGLE